MTCDDVKKELALRLVGLGATEKSGEAEVHAQTCSVCAKRLEKVQMTEKSLAGSGSVHEPDFDRSWRIIESRSFEKRGNSVLQFLHHRWALVGGIVIVFILGAVAGRVFLFGPKTPSSPEVFAGMSPESAWRGYADRLELILVDFGNRAEIERPAALVRQEKVLVERILNETRALKALLSNDGDKVRVSLLNDAELLLSRIADLRPGDKTSEQSVAKIIRESPLKARLRTLGASETIL
jgi:hypothetical protein